MKTVEKDMLRTIKILSKTKQELNTIMLERIDNPDLNNILVDVWEAEEDLRSILSVIRED